MASKELRFNNRVYKVLKDMHFTASREEDPTDEDYHIITLKIRVGFDSIDQYYGELVHKHEFNVFDTCKCGIRFEE